MDRQTAAQVVAAQRSYDRLTAEARTRTLTQLRQAWLSLGQYRDADIERWLDRVVPLVTAGEWTIAQLTSAYLARVAGLVEGARVSAETPDRAYVTGAGVRGVDPREVYRRPAVTLYSSLAAGLSFRESVKRGLDRVQYIASMDMQLARTHTVATSTRVKTFRRTLSGLEDCALCVIASTQRYHRGDLMPVHPGCDCGVAEVLSDADPGQTVDAETLAKVRADIARMTGRKNDPGARDLGLGKTDAEGNRISDYTELIVTREHGEYGPTLAWRGQNFTSADDIDR